MSSDTTFDQDTLPQGWVQEWDPDRNHPFWVDTTVDPPHAIWVHPYEDEQFLSEHPEIREGVRAGTLSPPPAYEDAQRHSFARSPSSSTVTTPDETAEAHQRKRSFFGKLMDKTIGSKDESEARLRRSLQLEEQNRQLRAQRREQRVQELRARYGTAAAMHRPPPGNPYAMSKTLGGGYDYDGVVGSGFDGGWTQGYGGGP